jgi:hypothetical protein
MTREEQAATMSHRIRRITRACASVCARLQRRLLPLHFIKRRNPL